MDGCKSTSKDCLQQSKIIFTKKEVLPVLTVPEKSLL
jgi:hypothetical protein